MYKVGKEENRGWEPIYIFLCFSVHRGEQDKGNYFGSNEVAFYAGVLKDPGLAVLPLVLIILWKLLCTHSEGVVSRLESALRKFLVFTFIYLLPLHVYSSFV